MAQIGAIKTFRELFRETAVRQVRVAVVREAEIAECKETFEMSAKSQAISFLIGGIMVGVSAFLYLRSQRTPEFDEFHYEGRVIPSSGLKLNPKGSNLGDPVNAELDLRRIHAAMIRFWQSESRLPKTPWELLEAGKAGAVDLSEADFINDDAQYADSENLKQVYLISDLKERNKRLLNRCYAFNWTGSFPNGKPKPQSPFANPKLCWVSTSIYERNNGRVRQGLKYEFEPTGFTIKLWSDGTITREGPEDKMMTKDADGSWRPFVKGHESAVGRVVVTETEFYRRLSAGTAFAK